MRLGLGLGFGMRPAVTVVSWVQPGATLDMDFVNKRFSLNGTQYASDTAFITAASITSSRTSSATDLLPTSPSGFAFNTYSANVRRLLANGVLSEGPRSNVFLNSGAPVTQTITLATGKFTIWVNGSGSAAVTAGTATLTGAGTATNGSPVTINISVGGTIIVTITGSLQHVQAEAGAGGTSAIITVGASANRTADIFTLPKGTWYGPTAGTFFAQWGPVSDNNGFAPRLLGASNGSIAPAFMQNNNTVGTFNGSVALMSAAGASVLGGGKFAYTFNATGRAVCYNAGTVATDANLEVAPAANFTVGNDNGANQFSNGFLKRIWFVPSRSSNATLQSLTT